MADQLWVPFTLSDRRFLRLFLLCVLYLAQGLAFGFVTETLANYLAAHHFARKQVTEVIFIAQFPWTFKFLWGPVIDRFSFPSLNLGRRRPWILFAQGMMILTLLPILFIPDLSKAMTGLMWIIAIHNIFVALQDVSTDALAVDLLEDGERGMANGLMRGSVYLGTFIGGAILGTIAHRYGLAVAMSLQLILISVVILAPALLREHADDNLLPFGRRKRESREEIGSESVHSMRELLRDLRKAFSLRSAWIAAGLAIFVLTGSSLVSALRKLLLLQELGWNQEEYSQSVGGIAYFFALGGSILGGFLADRFSAKRVAAIASAALGFTWLAFALLESHWESRPFVIAMTFAEQGFIGIMTVSIFAIFMRVSWPVIAGTQFTAYMALLNVSLVLGTRLAGQFVDAVKFSTLILIAGCLQLALIAVLKFIDPGETRRVLGDG